MTEEDGGEWSDSNNDDGINSVDSNCSSRFSSSSYSSLDGHSSSASSNSSASSTGRVARGRDEDTGNNEYLNDDGSDNNGDYNDDRVTTYEDDGNGVLVSSTRTKATRAMSLVQSPTVRKGHQQSQVPDSSPGGSSTTGTGSSSTVDVGPIRRRHSEDHKRKNIHPSDNKNNGVFYHNQQKQNHQAQRQEISLFCPKKSRAMVKISNHYPYSPTVNNTKRRSNSQNHNHHPYGNNNHNQQQHYHIHNHHSAFKRRKPCIQRFTTYLLVGGIVCYMYVVCVVHNNNNDANDYVGPNNPPIREFKLGQDNIFNTTIDLRQYKNFRYRTGSKFRSQKDEIKQNFYHPKNDKHTKDKHAKQLPPQRSRMRPKKPRGGSQGEHESFEPSWIDYGPIGFVSDLVQGLLNFMGQKKNVERLPDGCVRPQWQTYSFNNCNEIHEIDLKSVYGKNIDKKVKYTIGGQKQPQLGYLNSGLWRSVWLVDSRHEPLQDDRTNMNNDTTSRSNLQQHMPAVLKVMKSEHDFNVRNLDRHRRDALVMERLSSSPNIVDIYGYCGNTVLTEYAGEDLSDVLHENLHHHKTITRETPEGRLRLALDVMKGIQAIHDIPGGPIVHADVTAKQFLIDSNGNIKLNDFNRCRFMGHYYNTTINCPLRIPSAPGKNRSPEEYEEKMLNEKLDVYSSANVLYSVLTGLKPWDDMSLKATKNAVKSGHMPYIPFEIISDPDSTDTALAELIRRAYELKPEHRISASELVIEIEKLLLQYNDNTKVTKFSD